MRATKLYFIDHVKLSLLFLHFQKNINKMETMPGKATKIEILQMTRQKFVRPAKVLLGPRVCEHHHFHFRQSLNLCTYVYLGLLL